MSKIIRACPRCGKAIPICICSNKFTESYFYWPGEDEELQKQKDRFKEITGHNPDELEWDVSGWHSGGTDVVINKRDNVEIMVYPNGKLWVNGLVVCFFKALFKHIIDTTPYQPESVEVKQVCGVFFNKDGEQVCGDSNALNSCRFMRMRNYHSGTCIFNQDVLVGLSSLIFSNCPCKVKKREVKDD